MHLPQPGIDKYYVLSDIFIVCYAIKMQKVKIKFVWFIRR